jgi:thymidine kinase
MNSGKTTNLMQVAHNYEERGMTVALMKPQIDTKGDSRVISRLGLTREVDILLGPQELPSKLLQKYPETDCVLIDEAQFLSPEQVDDLFWYAVKQNKPVIAYGLRTDFMTKGFPGATRLLELAHSIEELKTICRCGKKAVLNGRKKNGKFIFAGDQVAIDGEDAVEYESLCANCYHNLTIDNS